MQNIISVIVPVYNVENYLDRCINSIINQSFRNFELLLIDDGSIDSSGIICDEYAKMDPRIRVIHTKNGGVSCARNIGIENATGNFISFIDSDDFIHPLFLELLYHGIISTNADIAICDFEKRNDNTIPIFDNNIKMVFKEISHNDFSIYRVSSHSNVVTKLYRIDILKNHYFDSDLYYGEDAVFNFSLVYSIKNIKMIKIDSPLYFYYVREDSTVHTLPRAISFQEFEWYLSHWNIFLKEYEHIVWIHSVKKMIHIRFAEYNTSNYDIVISKWKDLSKQYIKKMWSLKGINLTKKIRYYIMLKYFWLYRLFLILNDPSILDYEKEKKSKIQTSINS